MKKIRKISEKGIEKYTSELRDSIMRAYLGEYAKFYTDDTWPLKSQAVLRSFVLSRPGWQKSEQAEGVYVFDGKYPIEINFLYSESPGMLMIDTAVGIAKAELVEHLQEKDFDIEKYVRSVDWIIPFVRRRVN